MAPSAYIRPYLAKDQKPQFQKTHGQTDADPQSRGWRQSHLRIMYLYWRGEKAWKTSAQSDVVAYDPWLVTCENSWVIMGVKKADPWVVGTKWQKKFVQTTANGKIMQSENGSCVKIDLTEVCREKTESLPELLSPRLLRSED